MYNEVLKDVYDKVKKIDTFLPTEKTSAILQDVYKSIIQIDNQYDLWLINYEKHYMHMLDEVRYIMTTAEFELEKKYAQDLIIQSDNIHQKLQQFLYYLNYEKIVDQEYDMLLKNHTIKENKTNRILFMWSGFLPLSAIILAQKYKIHVDLVEKDEYAVEISRKLMSLLWLDSYITIYNDYAEYYASEEPYDVVYIAASVLDATEFSHDELLQNIQANIKIKMMLCRSTYWLRTLFYKPLQMDIINKIYSIKDMWHPKNELINSIVLITFM